MQTQVSCPQCGVNFATEIHQVVDSKHTPQLKQALLNGQLNLAQCPSCGHTSQLSTLLLFHDPEYETFIIHVPPQLNLNTEQREQMIGQLAQQVMNNLPQEERRAYMFQPEIMLNYQTFMERVLETEGITKETIARQKKQTELLRQMIGADSDVVDHHLKENKGLIDEAFFAMLQMFLDQALQMNDSKSSAQISNLRAKLMRSTDLGQQMERRQIALHKFNQAAKKQGGLTPQLLLDHILLNLEDDGVVEGLIAAGQQAMVYEFFALLTTEIEKRQAANDPTAQRLTQLRQTMLEFQQAMKDQSEKMLGEANQILQTLLDAPDKQQALSENINKIDDAFMYVLSAKMNEAQQAEDHESFKKLAQVQAMIMTLVESQLPPEIQLLNQLVRAESEEAQAELLEQNQALLTPDLLNMMDRVITQAQETGHDDQENHLKSIKALIASKVA